MFHCSACIGGTMMFRGVFLFGTGIKRLHQTEQNRAKPSKTEQNRAKTDTITQNAD